MIVAVLAARTNVLAVEPAETAGSVWVAPGDFALWVGIQLEDKTKPDGQSFKLRVGFSSEEGKWFWKEIYGRAKSITVVGDTLYVGFDDGQISQIGKSAEGSLLKLPAGYELEILTSDADRKRLFALGRAKPFAFSQSVPSTLSATEPSSAPSTEPMPSSDWRIFEYTRGTWGVLVDLPVRPDPAGRIRYAVRTDRVDLIYLSGAGTFTWWVYQAGNWQRFASGDLPVSRFWLGQEPGADGLIIATVGQRTNKDIFSLYRWTPKGELVPTGPLAPGDGRPLSLSMADLSVMGDSVMVVWMQDSAVRLARFDLSGKLLGEPSDIPAAITPQSKSNTREPWILLVLGALIIIAFFTRAMNPVQLELPKALVLARYWRRGLAAMIDLFPVSLLTMVIFQNYYMEYLRPGMDFTEMLNEFQAHKEFVLINISMACLFGIYCGVTELIWSATPGKRLLGLTIWSVKLPDAKPKTVHIIIRNAVKILELALPWLLVLTLLFMLLSPARQRIGDWLSGTIVVQRPSRTGEYKKYDD
jgi:uncharacterized RDD family membrane protein YckC